MHSVRRTAVVGLVGVAAVTCVALAAVVYWRARTSAHAATIDELRLRAETVAGNIEIEHGVAGLEVPLPMTPEYTRPQSGVYFTVWTRAGDELHRSPSLGQEKIADPPAWQPTALALDEVDDGPFGARCARIYLSFVARTEDDSHGWVATAPLADRPSDALLDANPEERRFHLMIAIDTRPRDERLAALLTFLLAAGAGAIGLAAVLAVVVSRRLVAPLARMQREALELTPDDPERRLNASTVVPELVPLARALNAAFDRLQAAFERQRQLTADVSHELRTPLAFLRGNAELLLRRDRTPDEYRTGLREQLEAAENMTVLAESILTLARADAGTGRMERAPVQLVDVARRAVRDAQRVATERGLELHLEAGPDVVVDGDEERLAQVADNLIANALKFTPRGGRVGVQVTREGADAVLAVEDTGPGVPEPLRERLFERFFRADDSRGTTDGFGLGLAIVRWIVEAHGGSVAASFPEAGGSVFRVRLPAC